MKNDSKSQVSPSCVTRRGFLLAGGTTITGVCLASVLPGVSFADADELMFQVKKYPKKLIAKASGLADGKPLRFFYPHDIPHCSMTLVKLGTRAGGGVGDLNDIVAFSTLCPHQGGPLQDQYHHEDKIQGPCAIHLSTFDLTRHGMIVAGHATEPLPQVVLEVQDDSIYAVAVLGLIYGHASNLDH